MRRKINFNQEVINNNSGNLASATRTGIKIAGGPMVAAAVTVGEFGGNMIEKYGGDNDVSKFLSSALDQFKNRRNN